MLWINENPGLLANCDWAYLPEEQSLLFLMNEFWFFKNGLALVQAGQENKGVEPATSQLQCSAIFVRHE